MILFLSSFNWFISSNNLLSFIISSFLINSSFIFRKIISYCLIKAWCRFILWLIFGRFFIFFARFAKQSELKVSFMKLWQGDIIVIKVVIQLPPSESSNNRVNFESRYGIWDIFPFDSVKAFITLPRADRLLFIFLLSSSCLPLAPVIRVLSLPAKSTKFNLLIFFIRLLSSRISCSNVITKIACDRLDISFIVVLAIALLSVPLPNKV